jgi:hypothetical protein
MALSRELKLFCRPHRPCRFIAGLCLLLSSSVLPGADQRNGILSLAASTSGPKTTWHKESVGPWGKLEYFPVTLEPPASHLWEALYDERSYWNFGNLEVAEARPLLETLGLSKETLALIDSEGIWKKADGGLELEFGDRIVESLTPENRTALARWFRLNSNLFFTKTIINFEGGNFSFFENGGVAPETLDLVKRYSFSRRNVLSLMDRPYILRKLGENTAEKERFLRATFSTKALIVRLVMDGSVDLDSIIQYWSCGELNTGFESILRGSQATEGLNKVDLVQILPPVPRRYLYGFTNLQDVSPNNTPDCFWTSVQFFRRQVSPRLLDPVRLMHHIEGDFERIETEDLQFGDLVCMFDEADGGFLHSYVHIADDIVFSKNGASFARPYVLTLKSDMLSVYLDESRYRFEVYRRKFPE